MNCLNYGDMVKPGLDLDMATDMDCCRELNLKCVAYKFNEPYAPPTAHWCVTMEDVEESDYHEIERLARPVEKCCKRNATTASNTLTNIWRYSGQCRSVHNRDLTFSFF